jgi:uncharacterized protein YjaG (DUF416 family)
MIPIWDENYYIDLDRIEEFIDLSNVINNELSGDTNDHKINVVKYEMVKMMLEVIMSEHSESDEKLGIKHAEISIPFRLAFNSLLNKKIISSY